MYNRYIPQNDGTHCRRPVQEPHKTQTRPRSIPCPAPQPRPETQKTEPPQSIGCFLKQLLPKDFTAEDLLVVVLLLLMSNDCPREQNSALLTLILYLFL